MLNSVCCLKKHRLQFLHFFFANEFAIIIFCKLITVCLLNCITEIIQATEGRKLVSSVVHCRQNPIGMVGYSA